MYGSSEPRESLKSICDQFLSSVPCAPRHLDYLDCDHVVVDIAGGKQGAVDVRLEALGHQRRASVIVPYHALAAGAVCETRLVATLPMRFVGGLAENRSQVVIEAPAATGPVSFSMAWHPRLDSDPAHCWLRDTIRATANQDP